jgi:branched-chain amino acid transport system permease protein
VAAIGAIGLNLLTGYAGQVSLGQAFFLGAGAYVAVGLGVDQALPLLVWLPAAFVVGSLLGAAIGPAALRLRGDYLAIVTIGVVFLGEYVFSNWHSLTGGSSGTASDAPVTVGPLNFADLRLAGESYSRQQGYYWLIWAIVAVIALLVKNISRTRPGRALQAVRDRDLAAEVIGVPLARYKVSAFALSSGLAAVAGALFASLQQYVDPGQWNLALSISYLAMIIVGGVGTVLGAVLGAFIIVTIPRVIERYSTALPGVSTGAGDHGLITVSSLNLVVFGLLIVLFLIFEPYGLTAVWLRVKAYFKTWPFSY